MLPLEEMRADAGEVRVMPPNGSGRPIRVLVTLSSLQVGGAERNVVSLLPHLRREGIDVSLCTLSARFDSYLASIVQAENMPRLDLGARRLLDPVAFTRFLSVVREKSIDIIHAEDQYATIFGALAARLTKARLICTRHNVVEEEGKLRESIRNRLQIRAANTSVRCIAVSDAVAEAYHELSGMPRDRIVTIYNGIDLSPFEAPPTRKQTRSDLGWAEDEQIIIFVAVVRADKGHDILFRAYPEIRASIPKTRLVLVGDGPHLAIRRREAQEFGDHVQFLGHRDDVPNLLAAADLFVSPSRNEGLPTVLIEAGAAGLPVVATDVGGTREIVENDVTGFIVPPESPESLARAVIDALNGLPMKKRLGDAAVRRIQNNFTLRMQAERTARLYCRVLEMERE